MAFACARSLLFVASVVTVASSCAPQPGAPLADRPPLALAMARHDRLAVEVRDAIARADLARAASAAQSLAAVVITPVAGELGAMRAAASKVAKAPDLSGAAGAFGELAATCSDCHARRGHEARVPVGAPPPDPLPGSRRMPRHAWATEQLWSGIVFNAEAAWLAGAEVLADPALAERELIPGKTAVPEVDARAHAMQRIGTRAQVMLDPSARARLFGELLGDCAGCHQRSAR